MSDEDEVAHDDVVNTYHNCMTHRRLAVVWLRRAHGEWQDDANDSATAAAAIALAHATLSNTFQVGLA